VTRSKSAGSRSLRIGIVTGDDILQLLQSDFDDLRRKQKLLTFDGQNSPDDIGTRLLTANVYLGAEPVVHASNEGADIVITGRVADPSLTAAACIHHFGWAGDDHDQVAGHLIECGTQVTGGILTDWPDIPDPAAQD